MVDANSAPRRVSMAYILGFSNRPFKDGERLVPAQPPPPRHPSTFKQMVTTPGGVIEWAASDGRRGKLTGPGKPRLTATDLAKASGGNVLVQKDTGEDEGGRGMFGLLDDVSAAPGSAKAAQCNDVADNGWTKEIDDKLLELRGESPNAPWLETAKELDKKEHECKERFKQIRPPDWKPNNAKGNKQKQGKQKGQKNQNNQKGGEKKDEPANGGFDASADNSWPGGGDGGWGNADNKATQDNSGGWNSGNTADADNAWGGNSGGNDNWGSADDNNEKDNTNGQWGDANWDPSANNKDENKTEECFNNTTWGNGGGSSGDNNGVGTWDSNTGGGGGGGEAGNDTVGDNNQDWNNTSWADNNNATNDKPPKQSSSKKSTSNRSSNKAPSCSKQHSRSKSDNQSKSVPTEYEIKPDSTFSADDLRLIARILQQDCHMVWNRVSWRFRDKTGRNLHPDVFEKRITGRIEERGSERSGR